MAKIPRTKSRTGEIVISALKKLMKNTGWTSRTIIKFIKLEYKISDPRIGTKITRVLKRGVKTGMFQTENGRYRLSAKAALSKEASLRNMHTQKQKKRICACIIRRRTPELCDYRQKKL